MADEEHSEDVKMGEYSDSEGSSDESMPETMECEKEEELDDIQLRFRLNISFILVCYLCFTGHENYHNISNL